MRIALVHERKADFRFTSTDVEEMNSELLSEAEEREIVAGLREAGHEVVLMGDGQRLLAELEACRRSCDLVFNLAVGYRGLDRKSFVPGLLELAAIPYVGSRPYAQSLARHKYHAKLVAHDAGVATPACALWRGPEDDARLRALPYPAVVKPVAESCSLGVSVESTPAAARARAAWIVETFAQPAIVEQFIPGVEVEVPLLGWPRLEALGVVGLALDGAPITGEAHLDAGRVYHDHYAYTAAPAELELEAILAAARRAGQALGLRDYGRVDFRVAADGTPYFIDAAATPHITRQSSFFCLAERRGHSHAQMLDAIVRVAWARATGH